MQDKTTDPPPTVGVKRGHKWRKIPNNQMNFVCTECGIIGYVSKSVTHTTQDSDIETTYDCDEYLTKSVMGL